MRLFAWLLTCGFVLVSGTVVGIQGGSDGPTPFSKIAAPKKLLIPTESSISSFAVLEKSEKIAYIDSRGELRLNDLKTGNEKSFGRFLSNLLPIVDPSEQFLLSRNLRSLKELKAEGRSRELQLPMASDFLFWNEDQLFLAKKLEKKGKGIWDLSYHRLDLEKNTVIHRHCEFDLGTTGSQLKLAQGHRFPSILLYETENRGEFSRLSFYQMNIRQKDEECSVELMGKHTIQRSEIQLITLVGKEKNIAIITDHPQENLYYGKPEAFKSTQLPSGISYIPNPERPVVVNLNRKKGVGVYSLETERYFTLDVALDRGLLFGNQIWVTSDGEKLFLSTRDAEDGQGERALHTLTLEGLY